MISVSDALTFARIIADALARVGIRDEVAMRYGFIFAILLLIELGPAPPIISAVRTLKEQRSLYEQWKRGAIANKPARFSWHTEGLAIDVWTGGRNFDVFTELWILFGGRWGGNFFESDRAHFDFPVKGIKPKPAF